MSEVTFRKIFIQVVADICKNTDNVGVALSAGKDSSSVLFALLELKKKVTAYSFHVEDIQSTDFIHAKQNAKTFKVPFVECIIPKKVSLDNIKDLMARTGCKKKVEIECYYPYYYILPKVKESLLLLGLGSDTFFCLSKKGMIHYSKTLDGIRKYRELDYEITINDLERLNLLSDVGIYDPFADKRIYNYFYNKSWKEINKPRQKETLLVAFPEYFNKIKLFNQMNLQCGDSGLREIFVPLLKDRKINYKHRTRVLDLYSDIYERVNNAETVLL